MTCYLVLLHYAKLENADVAKVGKYLATISDEKPKMIWSQDGGTGIAVIARAHTHAHTINYEISKLAAQGINRTLVLEIGPDWSGETGDMASGWLNTHLKNLRGQ